MLFIIFTGTFKTLNCMGVKLLLRMSLLLFGVNKFIFPEMSMLVHTEAFFLFFLCRPIFSLLYIHEKKFSSHGMHLLSLSCWFYLAHGVLMLGVERTIPSLAVSVLTSERVYSACLSRLFCWHFYPSQDSTMPVWTRNMAAAIRGDLQHVL